MSSGHWTNTGMAKFINDNLYNYKSDDEKSMNPFRWYRLQNGDDVSKYRETINGFPCRLILINDGSTPLNEGQNEPTPGNTKDMGIFNFNHDKDATKTLGFDSDIFPNCASYEVTANSDTSAGAFMSYKPTIKACVDAENAPRTWLNYIAMEGVTTIKLQNPYNLMDTTYLRFSFYRNLEENPWDGITGSLNTEADISGYSQYPYFSCWISGYNRDSIIINNLEYKIEYVDTMEELKTPISLGNPEGELTYLKESFELRHPDEDDVAEDWGFMGVGEEGTGLKALIDWVDNCTDEEFVNDFEEHFHKDYTLRYFCLVTLVGAVDNLGKNLMLDTADNKIYFPRFYDID